MPFISRSGGNLRTRFNTVIVFVILLVLGSLAACSHPVPAAPSSTGTPSFTPTPGAEVEATEFMGTKLTPLNKQLNNAIEGVIPIDRSAYRLMVDGLVDNPLSLSYNDLLSYPQISKLMDLNCVEGWNFTAKWSGPALNAILHDARFKTDAQIAIFYTPQTPYGFTSLDLAYIQAKNIIIALKDNDITLPPERGFPFQVVAESKYGYKWVKWVVRIELSADTSYRGYWESQGYNHNADIHGPKSEPK
jgi:DMSO/TMAO reductase YedYZ molybdopterin-dependent catalytic subunit